MNVILFDEEHGGVRDVVVTLTDGKEEIFASRVYICGSVIVIDECDDSCVEPETHVYPVERIKNLTYNKYGEEAE